MLDSNDPGPGGDVASSSNGAPKTSVTILRAPVVVMPGALATHGPTPPIGAAYVAAALRDAGHAVQLIDGAGEAIDQWIEIDSPVGPLHQIGLSLDEIVERIDPSTTVVGITIASLFAASAVVERAFTLNGIGSYLIQAALSKEVTQRPRGASVR